MLKENEIPKEDLVIINGKEYSKKSRYVVKDFFTNDFIYLGDSTIRYNRYYAVSKVVNGRVETKNVYTISSNIPVRVTIQKDLKRPYSFDYYYFRDIKHLEEFCKKNDYVKGPVTGYYLHKDYLEYDRVKPFYFNNTKYKQSVYDLLLGYFNINKDKAKTVEYKELEHQCFRMNEKYGIESKTYRVFEGLRYSFGCELETSTGTFLTSETKLIEDLNVQAVFDGSLRDKDKNGKQIGEPWGAEYVTGVLKGDSGLKHLHKIVSLVSERCKVDDRAAFHVHIGSLKWNSEDIAFMYILGKMLEDEIFSMMPKSRKGNQYCKDIPNIPSSILNKLSTIKCKSSYKNSIKELYNYIFHIVGRNGSPSSLLNKKTQHPKGRHGGYDRENDHRYSWLNFTNIIFNQRGSLDNKTIEFRVHPGTLSYKKIQNWIKICMGIVEFIHIGKKDIIKAIRNNKKITLSDILTKVYPKTSSKLISYIELRKNLFSTNFNEDVDYVKEDCNIKNFKDLLCV